MILADKILNLRKKNGWSQEELAQQLGVSRQSVSKWEGAQAIPDIERIIDLSHLFGVSTDFLIRDELEFEEPAMTDAAQLPVETGRPLRHVTMEEANEFLSMKARAAGRVAGGVSLCILSAALLLVILGLNSAFPSATPVFTEEAAIAIGMTTLLLMVAAGVAAILVATMPLKRFEFLETEQIETEYGVHGMVRARSEQYQETHTRNIVLGVGLCIVSAVPIIVLSVNWAESAGGAISVFATALTLVLVALGVNLLVRTSIINGSFQQLLEEGDYTPEQKAKRPFMSQISGIYWLLVVAGYLAYSFGWNSWDTSWIIWPVAAVIYGAFVGLASLVVRGGK
nr:helix-turn-helix transcriptional regulator [Schaalia sp. Marseille-Q2122]